MPAAKQCPYQMGSYVFSQIAKSVVQGYLFSCQFYILQMSDRTALPASAADAMQQHAGYLPAVIDYL
jgi:hypothetical protein